MHRPGRHASLGISTTESPFDSSESPVDWRELRDALEPLVVHALGVFLERSFILEIPHR